MALCVGEVEPEQLSLFPYPIKYVFQAGEPSDGDFTHMTYDLAASEGLNVSRVVKHAEQDNGIFGGVKEFGGVGSAGILLLLRWYLQDCIEDNDLRASYVGREGWGEGAGLNYRQPRPDSAANTTTIIRPGRFTTAMANAFTTTTTCEKHAICAGPSGAPGATSVQRYLTTRGGCV